MVEEYGKKYQIKYNPDEATFMVLNGKCNNQQKQKSIERVKCMTYLGQEMNEDLAKTSYV